MIKARQKNVMTFHGGEIIYRYGRMSKIIQRIFPADTYWCGTVFSLAQLLQLQLSHS